MNSSQITLRKKVLHTNLFFIYSSGNHRALHSFPTRRSSDLDGWRPLSAVRYLGGLGQSSDPALPKYQDRKSTRLNSSHRCISYAVFCLKKKKSADGADANRR